MIRRFHWKWRLDGNLKISSKIKIRLKIENFIGKEPFIQKDKSIENENWIKNEKQIEIRDQIRNENMLKMIYKNRLIVFLFWDQEIWKGERSVTGGEGCGWGERVHMVWKEAWGMD